MRDVHLRLDLEVESFTMYISHNADYLARSLVVTVEDDLFADSILVRK